jgi:mandelate racemase
VAIEGVVVLIRSVEATLVVVPMRRPLGTSAARVVAAPLLLVDVRTDEDVTGRAYLFCYRESIGHAALAVLRDAHEALAGTPLSPAATRHTLHARFKLAGVTGIVAMALAGIDTACWDALAIRAGLPLARLLGAIPRPIPAYNSNGLGLVEPAAAADEARELVAEGFRAIKMRLGRPDPGDDLAAARAVRAAIGPDVALMADYNQALDLPAARERCRALDDDGLAWIEEPVRHDDYPANACLAAELRTPIQLGENFAGSRALAESLRHEASDLVMPDLDRIGGVTGWQEAAALAEVAGIPLSSHLYPEVSAHLLTASPTAHWLEYVDWANPVLAEPLSIVDGHAIVPDRPGNGLLWNPEAVAAYRVDR